MTEFTKTFTDRRKPTLMDKVVNAICVLILFQLVCWIFIIYSNQSKISETQRSIVLTLEEVQKMNKSERDRLDRYMRQQTEDISAIRRSIKDIKEILE